MSDPAVDGDAGDTPQGVEHVLPQQRDDGRWLDLLAVLLATDPAPLFAALGAPPPLEPVVVRRDAGQLGRQPAPLLRSADSGEFVVGSALLVEPHVDRLRYAAYRTSEARWHLLLTSRSLPLGVPPAPWRVVAWEDLLTAIATGGSVWSAATARAWLDHAKRAVPRLAPGTAWGALRDGEDVAAAITARLSHLAVGLRTSTSVDPYLVPLLGERDVLVVEVPTARTGTAAVLLVVDGLPAHLRQRPAGAGVAPTGPHVLVGLRQDVVGGRPFDWAALAAVWPLMATARDDWDREPAHPPAAEDRRAHGRARAQGLPTHVGRGPGSSVGDGHALFGATVALSPALTLRDVTDELVRLVPLLDAMAARV